MKTIKRISVPTGDICIMEGDRGKLEYLSIGDYGKGKNIKADFLGYTKELNGVPSGEIEPLEEKWVITISTQYGCPQSCIFCDAPKVGFKGNATYEDLKSQVLEAINLHPEVKATKRLNIHYARMGEPTWNPEVIKFSEDLLEIVRSSHLGRVMVHPVFTTMLPNNNKNLFKILNKWAIDIKNDKFRGEAGLQFSINSTDEKQRNEMFNGGALSLDRISEIGRDLPDPKGRKYTLNFALADGYIVEAKKLRKLFSPEKFMVKITPIHETNSTQENNVKTTDGYEYFTPYKHVEEELKSEGFDVLVFIPSRDEDNSCITCGNAILGGSKVEF